LNFKINSYYVIYRKEDIDPTFGLYKCTGINNEGIMFETFYASGKLGQYFGFVKFFSDDFWPNHLYNLCEMKETDYNIFKSIIKTLL